MSDIAVITDTTVGEELIFENATVSKILGVQESTLRKYCTLMQKYQYEFSKNSVGHRIFYKRDVDVMKQIVDLKNASTLTLEQAVKAVLEVDMADASDTTDIADITDISAPAISDYHKLLEEFTAYKQEQIDFQQKQFEFQQQQMEFNKQLAEQLQKQDQYIKNSIEARDQKLVAAMRESMETKRQLIEAAKEATAAAEAAKRKKKSWWHIWR
ncbi:DUF3967 domain-containing protein [Lysinibacillus antri]|uniref:DUF3967 domain-containing protein n=1 Tax=Lysinibacillus antri TaxID=2498145 RepID=A0A3S0WEA1_9BACI|nr:DUF3967 domain-containing protein [Lysinibacillus antri]RUL47451.1 DUF3967 domain-containing protein [Lysinibacillus antri]